MREVAEASLRLTDGLVNWAIVAYPNEGWATTVFGEPAVERLWEAVGHAVRLDTPDPVVAWREHMARLKERAAVLNELRFDHLRYRGPGTDLAIGRRVLSSGPAVMSSAAALSRTLRLST